MYLHFTFVYVYHLVIEDVVTDNYGITKYVTTLLFSICLNAIDVTVHGSTLENNHVN